MHRRTGVGDAEKRVKRPIGDGRVVHTAGKFARLDPRPWRDAARVYRRDGRGDVAADRQQERDRNPRRRHSTVGTYVQ